MSFWYSKSKLATKMFTIFNTVMFSFSNVILAFMCLSLWTFMMGYSHPLRSVLEMQSTEPKPLSGWTSVMAMSIRIVGFSSVMSLYPMVHGYTVSIIFNVLGALLIVNMLWISSFTYDNNKFFSKVNVLTDSKLFSLFLACIEFVSFFIRPITLAIRLSANIIAGHVIFALIMFLPEPYLLFMSVFFLYFEYFVALIQAYIFVTLLNLYSQ
uniref:ATP synthase F0 subunit 6 n=1 Tax=Tubulipora flabellaris TaxID=365325 RepID=F6GPI7_9BILA|nr:ATP synthase F0 subunit 6 [Tubulipora flabellaris]ACB12458.1 ATP synthase F0 subunit 6 [Tubulipora flabellaris]